MTTVMTEEEKQADIDVRATKFKEDYVKMTKDLQIDFVSFPQFMQQADGSFSVFMQMKIVDRKFAPVESPLQPDADGIIKEK